MVGLTASVPRQVNLQQNVPPSLSDLPGIYYDLLFCASTMAEQTFARPTFPIIRERIFARTNIVIGHLAMRKQSDRKPECSISGKNDFKIAHRYGDKANTGNGLVVKR